MKHRVSSARPIAKVTAAAVAGAIVVILTWLLDAYAGVTLPDQVQSALTLLISLAAAYFTPLQPGEVEPDA